MKFFYSLFFILLLCSQLSSQIYEEVLDYGFGLGINESRPILHDLDNDGLIEMLVGHRDGKFQLWKQDEIDPYKFELITKDFNNILYENSCWGEVVDLDNDNLLDLVVDNGYGDLIVYEQIAENSLDFNISCTISGFNYGLDNNFLITDLDSNGLYDIIIACFDGYYKHYQQNELNSYEFTLVTDNFCNISHDICSIPSICDFDNDNKLDLIVGENESLLHYYRQTSPNSLDFEYVTNNFGSIYDTNHRKSCAFIDLDNDNLLDVIYGTQDGLIYHYEQEDEAGDRMIQKNDNVLSAFDIGSFSDPAIIDFDQDGILDLFIGETLGKIFHFRNSAIEPFRFELVDNSFNNIDVGYFATPVFCDLEDDGLIDLLVGNFHGNVYHYKQRAVASYDFELVTENIGLIDAPYNSDPYLFDLDNDELLDVLAGSDNGTIKHYEQNPNSPIGYDEISNNILSNQFFGYTSPIVTDIDGNNLYDILLGMGGGENKGKIYHFEQMSENSYDFELINMNFANVDVGNNARPFIFDIDSDGREDLIVGNTGGGLSVFRRIDDITPIDENVTSFNSYKKLYNFPNPFNLSSKNRSSSITINFEIDKTEAIQKSTIEIFNIKGQIVKTLHNKVIEAGKYQLTWNCTDQSNKHIQSGIYFSRLKTSKSSICEKILILK